MRKALAEHRVTLRITDATLKRAERLTLRASKDPKTLGNVTTTSVLKRAIDIGLDALEAEHAGK